MRQGAMKILFSFLMVWAFLYGCNDEKGLQSRAERFSQENIILDTHIDLPYRLAKHMEDITVRTEGNFDYPKARAGGLNAAFMAVYVAPETENNGTALATADTLIDIVQTIVSKYPDKFALVRSSQEIRSAALNGKVLLAMGVENGSALEERTENVEYFYNRGIRYITLTHSKSNIICDSSYDPDRRWNGLSPFGRDVIKSMNRIGMMIDVSHVSDSAFYQVLALSEAPVIASHSSCRKFTPDLERNLSDRMIRDLAAKGGVVQINFGSSFINNAYLKNFEPMWQYLEDQNWSHDDPRTAEYMKQYQADHPIDYADVSEVADHIDHVVGLVGIDYVGLGSDFDGLGDSLPNGLKDVSDYPNLIRELMGRGYSDSDLQKICAGNFLRVWTEIESFAKKS